jgi:hypothetical protein
VAHAPLAELVDALDLGSSIVRCKSSSLLGSTKKPYRKHILYRIQQKGLYLYRYKNKQTL